MANDEFDNVQTDKEAQKKFVTDDVDIEDDFEEGIEEEEEDEDISEEDEFEVEDPA